MSAKQSTNGLAEDTIVKALSLYEQIKQFDDIKKESVTIPEWGGVTVIVRRMSSEERDAYEVWVANQSRGADGERDPERVRNIRAKIARLCVVDEQGKHVFSDADIDWLGQKSAAALDRIYVVADRLSALSDKTQATVLGNSEPTSSAVSPSD